jgi:hypothetical protein
LPSSLTAKTQPAIHGGYFMAKAVLHDGKDQSPPSMADNS